MPLPVLPGEVGLFVNAPLKVKFPALRRRLKEIVLAASDIAPELQRVPAFDPAKIVDVLKSVDDVDERQELSSPMALNPETLIEGSPR